MDIKKVTVGPLGTNCYIVSSNGEGIIIDPGDVAKKIIENIGGLKIKYVVLTHNHFDHVGAVDKVCEKTGAKLMLHKADVELYNNVPEMFHFSTKPEKRIDIDLSDGDEIKFGAECLKVMHTPGHTEGGITLAGGGAAFCGDTVFYESVGRSDFPGGDFSKLLKSLEKILELPEDTVLYPGHGEATTVGHEKTHNPYAGMI
ncbi:MAG: MBL fold metallo-hydrolase [Clostridia bacterium]|nr:MBL fold metallo-hydrolase [Clostridia bacterium]